MGEGACFVPSLRMLAYAGGRMPARATVQVPGEVRKKSLPRALHADLTGPVSQPARPGQRGELASSSGSEMDSLHELDRALSHPDSVSR